MWLCIGPFDSDVAGVVNFQKSKLLKPATEYILGRKDRALRLNHKQISHDHLSFTVGEYSEKDSENPEFKPSLVLHNLTSKPRKLCRPTGDIILNPRTPYELEDGDVIQVLNGVTMTVKWEGVCCLYPPPRVASGFHILDCVKLGLSVVLTPHPSVTHHLTSTYSLTPPIATSLLSAAHLVKPTWLTTLLQSGTSTDGPSPLEINFTLPRVADYRPDYSPSVPSTLRTPRTWEPNEARLKMFNDYRVIFVGEKGREVTLELRELVKRGGGEYECCSVEGGRKALHSVLAKGQGKGKGLVLIADEPAMGAAIGQDGWMELIRVAADFGLRFIRAEKLTQAVVHVDFSYIDCTAESQQEAVHRFASPLPDVVPNTHAEEPSVAPQTMAPPPITEKPPSSPEPPPAPRLLRRAPRRGASRAPSVPPDQPPTAGPSTPTPFPFSVDQPMIESKPSAPPDNQEGDVPPAPKLKRRARLKSRIVGVDDPSVLVDADPSTMAAPAREPSAPPVQYVIDLNSSPPPAPRLKRRARTQQPNTQLSNIADNNKEVEEPPLKKFKTLFEASDPDKIAQSAMEEYKNMFRSQSPTQPESIAEYGTAGSSRGLAIVLEEEEESGTIPVGRRQTQGGEGRSQALKRKANVDEDGDIEMGEEEGVKNNKRRAVEGVDAVESTQGTRARTKPPSSSSKSSILKPTSSKTQAPKSHSSRPNSTAATTTTTTTTTDTNRAGSTKPTGAEPGKPDKDAAFLKAVASTKRGKKHEDAFDREFNNLRISKPDLDKEDELKRKQREYAILNDFGGEEDMRGNFMVVVEMEVPERREGGFRRGGGEGVRNDWIGRPDFKKFKKKMVGEKPRPVELFVEDEGGLSQLWSAGTQAPKEFALTPAQPKSKSKSKPPSSSLPSGLNPSQRKFAKPVLVEDDEDDDGVPPPIMSKSLRRSATPGSSYNHANNPTSKPVSSSTVKSKPSSTVRGTTTRSGSTKPDSMTSSKTIRSTTKPVAGSSKTTRTRSSTRTKKSIPLFIDSGDDEEEEGEGENFARELEAVSEEDEDEVEIEIGGTLRTDGMRTQGETQSKVRGRSGAGGVKRTGSRKIAVVMDDDSDDGVTFKGFAKKTRAKRG